jgi:hypothetical protein
MDDGPTIETAFIMASVDLCPERGAACHTREAAQARMTKLMKAGNRNA